MKNAKSPLMIQARSAELNNSIEQVLAEVWNGR